MMSDTFNIIVTLIIALLCVITLLQPFLLFKTRASYHETQKRLLTTAVEVEKLKMSWRARYRKPDDEY
jgi:hypothetical protein